MVGWKAYEENGSDIRFTVFFDEYFYAKQAGVISTEGKKGLISHYLSEGKRKGLQTHPLFDSKYYVSVNPDIGSSDPLTHYLQHGWREGRQPHPLFSPSFYLSSYDDVLQSGMEPLSHYIQYGWKEGRSPHPLFDPSAYHSLKPHLKPGNIDPLRHYLSSGWHNASPPHALIDMVRLREELEFRAQGQIEGSLLHCYLSQPLFWNASTHVLFDADYYASGFKGILPNMPLLVHYLIYGWREGRQPHPLFSPSYYLKRYPEVARAGLEPLTHFIKYGIHEFRQTHPLLCPEEYVERFVHVDNHPLIDYISYGGRRPANYWIDEDSILSQMSEIDGKAYSKGDFSALDRYLRDSRYRMIVPTVLFDPTFYLKQRKGVKVEPPLVDYMVYGHDFDLSPHPLVDEMWYREKFLSEVGETTSVLEHYLYFGYNFGWSTHVYFDEKYYKQRGPAFAGPGLMHYLLTGEKASERPNAYFSPLYYRSEVLRDSDAKSALCHFAEIGDPSGLRPSPEFDPIFYRSAYGAKLGSNSPLKHFLQKGQWNQFQPKRLSEVGLQVKDWLNARRREIRSRAIVRGSTSIALIALKKFKDMKIKRILGEELSAFNSPLTNLFEPPHGKFTAQSLLEHLESLEDIAFIVVVQEECIISRFDLELLTSSFEQNPNDFVAVPLSVSPDMKILNPPLSLDGSIHRNSADIDHPDFNFRREVWPYGAISAVFKTSFLKTILGSIRKNEQIELDALLARAISFQGKGVPLVSGAAAWVCSVIPSCSSVSLHVPRSLKSKRPSSILYVDATVPRPDQDAGSDTAWRVLQIMREMGFNVTFIPASLDRIDRKYIYALQSRGVRVITSPYLTDITSYIQEANETYDVAFLARAPVVGNLLDPIRAKWPDCKIIFNTVDLHYVRMLREAVLFKNASLFSHAMNMKDLELGIIDKVDRTIVLSEAEASMLKEENISASVEIVPPVYEAAKNFDYNPINRSGIFFIGGYKHIPNVDAVEYFLSEVWPLVVSQRTDIKFHIVGAHPPSQFSDYESETVKLVGYVEDIDDFMSRMRLMVSPLRYGAGVKVKVIASLSAGIPAVVTPPSIEGAGIAEGEGIRIALTSEDIARQIIELYDNYDELLSLSRKGKACVQRRYSVEALTVKYRELLKPGELA